MNYLKKFLKPLITGVLATLLMVAVMLWITIDFRWVLFIGSAVFFTAGYLSAGARLNNWITLLLNTLVFIILFAKLVLSELPDLIYFIPIYLASCITGLYFRKHHKKLIVPVILLLAVMSYMAFSVIPNHIAQDLTSYIRKPLPEFNIRKTDGSVVNTTDLTGKVMVLDFFGTWCKPCISELKELDKVQRYFEKDHRVVFYVINADLAGDSPEKFKAFIAKNNYNFEFAYDTGSAIFKQLNLGSSGLPSLLIIDKNQNIRFLHIGYNTAETTFADTMIKTIAQYLN